MDYSKKSTYLFSIDALRVIAILAVILIHITTKTLATLHIDITQAFFSLFLNQTARFAVPLFFIISGFVLELNNKSGISYKAFFEKRASKIIIPFVFWSTLYFIFAPEYGISKLLSLNFIWILIQGMAAYHLYFIPTLIIFYLAFPFLHGMMNVLKNPFVMIIILLVQSILLFQDYYIKQLTLQYDLRIASLSFSMFILGMVGSHYKDFIFKFVKKYFFVFIIALLILPTTIFLHVKELTLVSKSSRYIYNQFSLLNYVYTTVFALLFYFILEKTQFLRNYFITLSKLSFFVFFFHVMVQYILWDNVIAKVIESKGIGILKNVWFDPIIFTVIATISFTTAYFVHKITWAPKITG